jgi:hypothetical protein
MGIFQTKMKIKTPVCLCVIGLVFTSSCSGRSGEPLRAEVQGTVSLDGKPLPAGVIRFIPQAPTTGPAATAAVVDGHFALPRQAGPLVGAHRVEIESPPEKLPDPDDAAAVAKYLKENKQRQRRRREPIPSRYNSASDLTANIEENGENDLKFDLVSKR